MESIRELVAAAERGSALPAGEDERFSGYGLMGQAFSSGYLLALRRFPVTSVGPGYTSVWVRRPSGSWTMYTTVPAAVSCPRYFSSALEETSVHRIDVAWADDHRFTVDIADDVGLHWEVSLAATPVTRAMSALASALPAKLWRNPAFLRLMGAVAGPVLQAGKMGLIGRVPNGQGFRANPKRVWFISDSTATLGGEDLGSLRPLPVQTRLGDFWIPQRGIFMMGAAAFEPFNPAEHHALPAQ
jgi:hypothetical protein